jgi:hypothetical protein
LAAIVEKLHAKDPAKRYQTAAEVAEVLGRHLAEVQHPSVVTLPVLESPARTSHANRWTVAAAVLLCLLVGLGMAEGTGVTKLASTVIRIVTGEGTLVVETDPDVRITLDGNGDLTFQLAGGQSIRVPIGHYRVKATKEGKAIPLDKELVSIARGDNQVVRVRLEREPHIVATSETEPGAFVLLAAGEERRFDTMAEAVQRASDGDTIEIRGNGPFVSPVVNVGKHALTIRAGATFRPVIRASSADRPMNVGLLITEAPLALEGIEFQLMSDLPKMDEYHRPYIIQSNNAPLYVANCKFRYEMSGYCLKASGSPVCVVRNCEFTSGSAVALIWAPSTGGRCLFDHCILIRTHAVAGWYDRADLQDISIRLASNTVVGPMFPIMTINLLAMPNLDGVPKKPLRIESQANIFDGHSVLGLDQHPKENTKALEGADAEAFLSRLVDWQEQHNLYSPNTPYATWFTDWLQTENHGPKSLAEWSRFWGQADSKSLEGQVHFQGGNLLSRHDALAEQLIPEDFRLRADSAGYRAGPDGKDLGADVDLVGPGPAYERWKKTPQYQQWLKETNQITKAKLTGSEPDFAKVIPDSHP